MVSDCDIPVDDLYTVETFLSMINDNETITYLIAVRLGVPTIDKTFTLELTIQTNLPAGVVASLDLNMRLNN